MTIDTVHFTPIAALLGGLLIGAAAALFMLVNGRIAGVSGIVGGLFRPVAGNILWRFSFVIGLCLAPRVYSFFSPLPEIQLDSDFLLLIAAGLMVGVGTRYGSGCTSGHGICGISRLSTSSIVATVLFVTSGMVTVFILRHLLGTNA